MGRLEEAMKCYLTAVKIKPTFADAYANLAAAYKVTFFLKFLHRNL
jgi:tetratricopeptide (TPR) repeat protein